MASDAQKIIPHLWFDDQAEEAVGFYAALFGEGRTHAVTRYGSEGVEIDGRTPGSVMTVEFELLGYRFIALNGGPHFRFTPAISFFVTRESEAEIDRIWARLSDGGMVMMPLQRYPWSEKYGWIQDRYGLTWQISLGKIADVGQPIAPAGMEEMLRDPDSPEPRRAFRAMLGMKRIDLEALGRAYAGEGVGS